MRCVIIYIPLCFYFIISASTSTPRSSYIYIPLCFYFILKGGFASLGDIVFTFHYASTLSVSAGSNTLWSITIYIPLCFYFILLSGSVSAPACPYLHSTMLLLYRHHPWKYRSAVYSFTFHYASTLSAGPPPKIRPSSFIYIPLCFYFIHFRTSPSRSIRYLHSTMLLLYRRNHANDRGEWKHLHSTMLLLYPRRLSSGISRYQIYIPLCFYFITKQKVFTVCPLFIYIPLCFYFILYGSAGVFDLIV